MSFVHFRTANYTVAEIEEARLYHELRAAHPNDPTVGSLNETGEIDMPTWHQLKAGIPKLSHATMWSSYNPVGHLSVMRHESEEAARGYADKTGDVVLPPDAAARPATPPAGGL